MSDNFHFDMTGVPLELAFQIAFLHDRKAKGWAEFNIDPANKSPGSVWGASKGVKKRLVLFWTDDTSANKLPAPMTSEAMIPFVKAWLATAEYGPQPDHDGSNSKGYRVYNETWGHVNGSWAAFVAIEPIWLEHGK